jgi:hypothetical protein
MADTFSFRGFHTNPTTRDGVIFLFSRVAEELNIYIEEMSASFPTGRGRRYTGFGWEKVNIEFVYRSSEFTRKGYNTAACNIIICWEHDWNACPLEVIELADRLTSLPAESLILPDAAFEPSLVTLFDKLKVNENIRRLMQGIDRQIKETDGRIWAKVKNECIVYYSPERPFLYAFPKPKLVNFQLYSGGETIEGVRYYADASPTSKWGYINLDYGSIQTTLNAVKESYVLAREAVRQNTQIGHFKTKTGED